MARLDVDASDRDRPCDFKLVFLILSCVQRRVSKQPIFIGRQTQWTSLMAEAETATLLSRNVADVLRASPSGSEHGLPGPDRITAREETDRPRPPSSPRSGCRKAAPRSLMAEGR